MVVGATGKLLRRLCPAPSRYRSWGEERTSLVSQIEALRKEARLYVASNKGTGAGSLAGDGPGGCTGGSGGADGEGGEGSPQAQITALKKALDEAKENEVSLEWLGPPGHHMLTSTAVCSAKGTCPLVPD